MAYRIEYSSGIAQKNVITSEAPKKNRAVVALIVLAILGFLAVYSMGRDYLRDALIPGDPAVTEAAAIKFVDEIQQGTSIINAFGVFCREVIDGAKVQTIYQG